MEFNYQCSHCKKRFDMDPMLTVCPDCAAGQENDQPLRGVLEVELHGKVDQDVDILDLLPVEKQYFPSIPVGNTPLWEPGNLRAELGIDRLFIKDEGANPTFSFKDRASFLVSAFAKKHRIRDIVLASTGNAGSSMAGIGAAAGQNITLFLPTTAPEAKLVQALQYGARVFRVDGTYDAAYDLSLEFSRRMQVMSRNTAHNPMTLEGKKTVSLELYGQLKKAPDYVFVATGDGCILSGIYKGFRDLKHLGLIQGIPTIYSVQAETSNALYRAFTTGKFEKQPGYTIADSICVDVPRNGFHALAQLKKYNGRVITVSDDEIINAQAKLSRAAGLFAEPAGAAAFAGFLKARSGISPNATIVILSTGSGLKDSRAALRGVKAPEKTIRNLDQII